MNRIDLGRLNRLACAALVCAGAIACKPWTVRPIDETAPGGSQSTARFNPAAYVEDIWESKVLPAATASAEDVAVMGAGMGGASERRHVFIKGRARVIEIDARSRAGLIHLDARSPDSQSRVAIQIGPVLRGTSLRDALVFIRFSDFVNQLDFAAVATELNNRVLRSVLSGVDMTQLKGKHVSFLGAVTRPAPGAPSTLEIVPVFLQIEDATR